MQWAAPARFRRFLIELTRRERDRARLFEVLELLSHLLHQGFPLQAALHYLVDVHAQSALAEQLIQLAREVDAGNTLYGALGTRLPAMYASVLRVGEASGHLWRGLALCTEHQKAALSKRDQLIRTTSYPALLLVALGALVCTISFVMAPSYRAMYATLGVKLPLESAVIFMILKRTPAMVCLLLLCVVICLCTLLVLRRRAPLVWQMISPRLPFYKLLWTIRTERFCQMFYLFIDSGTSAADAFATLAEVGPRWLWTRMKRANSNVMNGVPLSGCFGDEWHPYLRTSLQLSEGTGDLRWCLKRTADQLEYELERSFRRGLKRLEPVLLLIVGSVLTGVMLAVFVPMYSLADHISAGPVLSGGETGAQMASQ